MALTLVEAAKLHASNGEFKKAGVTMAFAAGGPVTAILPAMTIGGNAYSWNEEGVLASVAARAVGENYTASEGKFTPRTEALKIYGGTLDVDRAIVKTLGEDKRSAHEALKAKALGQSLHYDIVEGTSTNAKHIPGLASRFPVGHAQTLDSAGTVCSMVELDEVIERCSSPTHLLMTRQLARLINVYLRGTGTAIRMEKDAFGKPLMFYNDLPIVIVDPIDVAAAYQPLQGAGGTGGGSTDDAAGETSIFVISASLDGLHLIQNGPMEIEDLGLTDEGTSYGTLVEWIVGLANEGPYCVSRYAGIDEDGTVTA